MALRRRELCLHISDLLCSFFRAAGGRECLCSCSRKILTQRFVIFIQCCQAAFQLRNLIFQIGLLLLCKLKLSLNRSEIRLGIGSFLSCSSKLRLGSTAFAAALNDRTVFQLILRSAKLIFGCTKLTAEAGQLRFILSNFGIIQAAAGLRLLFQFVAFFLKCIDL